MTLIAIYEKIKTNRKTETANKRRTLSEIQFRPKMLFRLYRLELKRIPRVEGMFPVQCSINNNHKSVAESRKSTRPQDHLRQR